MSDEKFTDEELKEIQEHGKFSCNTCGCNSGLIARVDEAENTIMRLLILCDSADNKQAIMEATLPWRKARGR